MKKSEELQQKIRELEQQAEEARKEELSEAIAQIRQIMTENGITMADLDGRRSGRKSRGSGTGSKRPPKFRDPVTGNTWAGVGRAPKWIVEAEAAGKSREDFRI
ncbi:H-NS histone family protein [Abyssibacter profundi]|uniref:Histone family protein nucleoid-structuring protein H-NS n=1 Tax=Abyssibacter profundi TaxID=2182787 RepID=A0A363UNB2_9GAMM|nr:H-NS histone family protein [Abyssibacter profundi]MBV61122.1 histone family protein nucleoid-structuring protein H-NS [Nevskiales bacterium]PWN56900.1 histone family protein nucleoid-structuring protein H-NS [Abyssibacter profundi]